MGWLPADDSLYPKATHVGFGLVLGEDGKRFRTRNTEVVRLVDLLDEAKNRSKSALIERGKFLDAHFMLAMHEISSSSLPACKHLWQKYFCRLRFMSAYAYFDII